MPGDDLRTKIMRLLPLPKMGEPNLGELADAILNIPEIREALQARNLLIASKLPHMADESVKDAIAGLVPVNRRVIGERDDD